MRTFVIGDVHGCLDELRNLVAAVNPRADNKFTFVGDICDKGINTIGALRYVKLLLKLYPGSVCIAGNHESKALERLRQDKGHKAEPWHQAASKEDWAFIKSMPLYHRVPGLNVIAVHGGFFPRFFNLYPQGLDDERLLKKENWQRGGGKYMGRARRFQYVRYINTETGDMLPLNEETNETPHWGELYDGREGFAFYGHQPYHDGQPKVWKHAVGIDTACVSGMFLTAAVLKHKDDGEYGLSYVQVSATEDTIENYHRLQVKIDEERAREESNATEG